MRRRSFVALALMAAVGLTIGCSTADRSEAAGPKHLKVLTIGNSFSWQMWRILPKVTADLGLGLDICSLGIGGCSLERHWKNVCAPNETPYSLNLNYDGETNVMKTCMASCAVKSGKGFRANIPAVLAADDWDVVTIQQASHASWRPDTYEPFGGNLVDCIRKFAPKAKIYVQETWSYTPWDKRLAKWGIDQNEMYARLHDAYSQFAAKHSLDVIPTGTAVQMWRSRLPVRYTENSLGGDVVGRATFKRGEDGKWQPTGDVFHMGPKGNLLQANVWAAKLYGTDVTVGRFSEGASESEAKLMREIAMDVVRGK